ncbi:MAG: ABC transporter substrate-binding protein [Eubacteriales Family XIII. Incertae Sedis bacterium]|nr:MAG: ABC transporter substrate-binding protein [Clostridiales Family XIII bacterium]
MKKLITGILLVVMMLSLAACGGDTADDDSSNTGAVYHVGVCQLVEHDALDAATEGFVDALEEKLGDAVEIEVQLAQGEPNNCTTIINNFVAGNVDLIMANATPALQAAVSGTDTIPILGTSVTEYGVALGIDNFNGTVGGNVSGTSDLAPLDGQAAMIQELFPEAKKVGLLYCSAEANSQYQIDVVTEELTKLGYECTPYSFSDSNDLATVATSAAENSDVIYVPTDNKCADNTGIIDNVCRPAKVPVVAGEEGIASGCGVATLSISYYDIGYQTGVMAAEILAEGADISTMPIAYAPSVTKKYNAEICQELGITIPDDYVAID